MNDRDSPAREARSLALRAILVLAVLATLLFLASLVFYLSRVSGPTRGDLRRLRFQGDEIVGTIGAFQLTTGSYPTTLELLEIEKEDERYGPWDYQPHADGAGFSLSIGDYGEDLFTLSWSSESGTWYEDT